MRLRRFLKHAEQAKNNNEKIIIFNSALKFIKNHKVDCYLLAELYLQLINVYLVNNLYSDALKYIEQGKICLKGMYEIYFFILHEANVYFLNNQAKKARTIILNFLRKEKEFIFPELLVLLAEIHARNDKINKAIYYLKKVIQYSECINIDAEDAYYSLIDLYRQYNMIKEAYSCLSDAKEVLSPFNYDFLNFHLLVKDKNYADAALLLNSLEKQIKYFPDLIGPFTGTMLEFFKQTNDLVGFRKYLNKSIALNKTNLENLWLIFDQAGDFYEKRKEFKKALNFYKRAADSLDEYRKKSFNHYCDKINFFKDKYYYLLSYTLYAYKLAELTDALYFLELSKSSSLRDDIVLLTLNFKQIKENM